MPLVEQSPNVCCEEAAQMPITEHEQRILALEATLAELKSRLPADSASGSHLPDDDVIPGAEYPFVPSVESKPLRCFRGRLRVVHSRPQGLGLSAAEWASLDAAASDEP